MLTSDNECSSATCVCGKDTCKDVVKNYNREKVYFIPSANGKSMLTAAAQVTEDNTMVQIGFAFAPKRLFSRKDGRKVAFGRVNKGEGRFTSLLPFNGHSSDAVVTFFNEIASQCKVLRHFYKIATADLEEALKTRKWDDPVTLAASQRQIEAKQDYDMVPSAWRKCKMDSRRQAVV